MWLNADEFERCVFGVKGIEQVVVFGGRLSGRDAHDPELALPNPLLGNVGQFIQIWPSLPAFG